MLTLISLTFTLSTTLWVARITADVVRLVNLRDGTSDTDPAKSMVAMAQSAVNMTLALSLINVSHFLPDLPEVSQWPLTGIFS